MSQSGYNERQLNDMSPNSAWYPSIPSSRNHPDAAIRISEMKMALFPAITVSPSAISLRPLKTSLTLYSLQILSALSALWPGLPLTWPNSHKFPKLSLEDLAFIHIQTHFSPSMVVLQHSNYMWLCRESRNLSHPCFRCCISIKAAWGPRSNCGSWQSSMLSD